MARSSVKVKPDVTKSPLKMTKAKGRSLVRMKGNAEGQDPKRGRYVQTLEEKGRSRRYGYRRTEIGRIASRMKLEGIGKANNTEEEASEEMPMEEAEETLGGPEEETEEEKSGWIPGEVAEGGEAKGRSPM